MRNSCKTLPPRKVNRVHYRTTLISNVPGPKSEINKVMPLFMVLVPITMLQCMRHN